MSRTWTIARRELMSYFYSPVAYVVLALFLPACAVAFWPDFRSGEIAGMRSLFEWMVWFLVFLMPLLSMGSIAKEWAAGTMESLMTAPVKDTDVVVGKFLGSFLFFLVMLAPTLLYVLLLMAYATPSLDLGPIRSGYLGIILVGALFISIGLFCSSLTKDQITAAMSSAAVLFLLTIVPYFVSADTLFDIFSPVLKFLRIIPHFWSPEDLREAIGTLLKQFVYRRYMDFSRGIVDTGHLVFFILTTAVFLFLTVKVLESRRWK
jgi:gliding motility-associated transport system permease protein